MMNNLEFCNSYPARPQPIWGTRSPGGFGRAGELCGELCGSRNRYEDANKTTLELRCVEMFLLCYEEEVGEGRKGGC